MVKPCLKMGLRTNLCPDTCPPSARGKQAGLRSKPNQMGPEKKSSVCLVWLKNSEEAEEGYRGPDSRDWHMYGWGDTQGTLPE